MYVRSNLDLRKNNIRVGRYVLKVKVKVRNPASSVGAKKQLGTMYYGRYCNNSTVLRTTVLVSGSGKVGAHTHTLGRQTAEIEVRKWENKR